MNLLEALSERLLEGRARGFGKGCARIMLISFHAMRENYKEVAPTYAWLARQALRTRPNWQQTGEETFTFEKTGESIVITDDLSLADVIHMVIDLEMPLHLTRVPEWRQQDLLRLAHHEADKFIHSGA